MQVLIPVPSMYSLNMIDKLYKNIILIAILMIGCLANSSLSQTVQFSMDVQPELGIEVLQDLNFGTVVANSGTQRIGLGDLQMGIFKIKALAAQSALLQIENPDHLISESPGDTKKIPLRIYAAYSDGPANYDDILSFKDNSLRISLGSEDISSLSPTWESGYIFIYGDIEVGEVSEGSYSGTLTLNVTYQ